MDWSNPIGSAVSGAFGIIGSGLNYAFQKKLAAQQNEYNLQMWNLQNEYNSPQAQMKRFEEAGLNPNLIYGQGNAGNASSAPLMVTPEAPRFSKEMAELAQAFNIEGLRTAIANRKKAQADAQDAQANAERNSLQLQAEKNLGQTYTFDPATGLYVERPLDPPGTRTVVHPAAYYANQMLAENFRTNSLLVPRLGLIGSQQLLNAARQGMLAPQTSMLNYQAKYFPWTFWIGNVKSGAQAVGSLVPKMKFERPPLRYSPSSY